MAANRPAANRPWQQIVRQQIVRQQIGGSKLSRTDSLHLKFFGVKKVRDVEEFADRKFVQKKNKQKI